MRLVVDTNIIVSAFIRNSRSRAILLHPGFRFYLPDYAIQEIDEHYDELLNKTGLEDPDCRSLLDGLLKSVTVIQESEFRDFLPQARVIMSAIDEDDVPFIACALSFKNDGIWSEDSDFSKQTGVRIWKTRDLSELL